MVTGQDWSDVCYCKAKQNDGDRSGAVENARRSADSATDQVSAATFDSVVVFGDLERHTKLLVDPTCSTRPVTSRRRGEVRRRGLLLSDCAFSE